MNRLAATWSRAAVLGLVVAALGCGSGAGGSSSGQASEPTEEAALQDLAGLLKTVAEQKRRPPAKLADLDVYEPIHMAAYKGVASGKVVFLWGNGYAPGDVDVIAYESTTEGAGGFVLLQDGTVKRLTAAEFAAAPKAKAAGPAGKK